MSQYPDSAWIRENYGTFEVLCFDTWSDGLIEAWTVSLAQADIDYILDEIRSGYRPDGRGGVTQDLLSDYDSEHFDFGTPAYDAWAAEVGDPELGWVPEEEWIAANL